MRLNTPAEYSRLMPRSKVTAKFQVTIPRDVREKVNIKPGETVSMEVVSEDEILVRRHSTVANPLNVLIGEGVVRRSIPVGKLEDAIETR